MTMNRLLILLTLPALACSDLGDRDGDGTQDGPDAPADEYIREFVFVPIEGPDTAPAPVVLHFSTVSRVAGVERTARGWAASGADWDRLYDLSSSGPAVRQPWRIVPQGPLRLLAGMDDDVEALVVRRGRRGSIRLEPGGFVTEWSPDPGAQILLREGTLDAAADTLIGWVVDARFGLVANGARSNEGAATGPRPGLVGPTDSVPGGTAPAAAEPGANGSAASADSAAADTVEYPSIQRRRSSVRRLAGVLAAGDGALLVLGAGSDGSTLFVWREGATESWPVTLHTRSDAARPTLLLASPGAEPAAVTPSVPAEGAVRGELILPADVQPGRRLPLRVSGQVEVGGRPFTVEGVLLGVPE